MVYTIILDTGTGMVSPPQAPQKCNGGFCMGTPLLYRTGIGVISWSQAPLLILKSRSSDLGRSEYFV
jgi:hypothetical protein